MVFAFKKAALNQRAHFRASSYFVPGDGAGACLLPHTFSPAPGLLAVLLPDAPDTRAGQLRHIGGIIDNVIVGAYAAAAARGQVGVSIP